MHVLGNSLTNTCINILMLIAFQSSSLPPVQEGSCFLCNLLLPAPLLFFLQKRCYQDCHEHCTREPFRMHRRWLGMLLILLGHAVCLEWPDLLCADGCSLSHPLPASFFPPCSILPSVPIPAWICWIACSPSGLTPETSNKGQSILIASICSSVGKEHWHWAVCRFVFKRG